MRQARDRLIHNDERHVKIPTPAANFFRVRQTKPERGRGSNRYRIPRLDVVVETFHAGAGLVGQRPPGDQAGEHRHGQQHPQRADDDLAGFARKQGVMQLEQKAREGMLQGIVGMVKETCADDPSGVVIDEYVQRVRLGL
jgi:hypothetical protein